MVVQKLNSSKWWYTVVADFSVSAESPTAVDNVSITGPQDVASDLEEFKEEFKEFKTNWNKLNAKFK